MRRPLAILLPVCLTLGCTDTTVPAVMQGIVIETTVNTMSVSTEVGTVTFNCRLCGHSALQKGDTVTVVYRPPVDNGFAEAMEVRQGSNDV